MSRRLRRLKKQDNLLNDENIDFMDQIYYINLAHRHDRKNQIESQINKLNLPSEKITRIEAIKHQRGEIGCGLSHIKALKEAKDNNYDNIVILEDDFEIITNTALFKKKLNYFYNKYMDYNICLLAGNIIKAKKIDNFIFEALDVQTTSGYIINKRFFNTLIENLETATEKLLKGERKEIAAIDVWWKKLQGENKKFYLFIPKLGKQRPSFSDIENRNTNYGV